MPNSPFFSIRSLMYEELISWGSFLISYGYAYILLVDYVSKWVETKATKANDAKVVVDFVRSNIFCRGAISAIRPCPPFLRSIGWYIPLIILKPMGRLRSLIGRSRRFCKRWCTRIEKIRANC
ncbi:hypothetical protein CR513_07991, partial [Mucuna pruriens]